MKKIVLFAVAALMIPSVALAKGPNPNAGTHTNQGKAKVMYVLKGTIYVSASDSTGAPTSITITVSHANRHGKLLVGQSIPVAVGANTKIVLENGVTAITTAASPGDKGMVKIRAPKMAFKGATSLALTTAMQSQSAHMVIDMGAASSS
jgi:hypothetical protein